MELADAVAPSTIGRTSDLPSLAVVRYGAPRHTRRRTQARGRRIGGGNSEDAITRSPDPASGLAKGLIDAHLASRRPQDNLAKARSTGIHGDRATVVFKPGVQPLGITGEAQSDDRD